MDYWEPAIEKMKLSDLKKLQLKRLRATLRRVYENSPFYRRRFREAGVTPDDLKTLDDLRKFPFTTKDDLRNHGYPYGGEFLTVPLEELVGWHMTSGTTGKPTVGPYTKQDIETWTNLVARCLVAAGVTKRDILLNIYGYGLFTGGIGLHYGAMAVGAKVIPWGVGRTEALMDVLYEWKPTVMTGTPSYQFYILEQITKRGLDPKKTYLRITIPGAEYMSFDLLKRIDEGFALKEKGGGPRQIYGSTELIGPGAGQATQCTEYMGFHMWTDHFYIEVVDPKTGEPVGEEGEGELVITHLTREAMPLVRYRQRDIVKVQYVSTDCGRDAFPLVQVMGRVDDVIFYKGAKLYPTAIQSALMKIPEVLEYQVIVDKRGAEHKFIIKVEALSQNPQLAESIADAVEAVAFARPHVEIVPPNTLPRWEGKSKRIMVYE
jgi:phenylacetate-CoA ligase